jgi:gmma-aminobutyric acid receptor subunit gamma
MMRQPIGRSETWQCGNNLSLNVIKTKEMIVDYRKRRAEHAPIFIDRTEVEQVESFKIPGVHISNKLSWSKHTKTVMMRAPQHLFPLKRLKRFGMGPKILKKLYSCSIESILTGCITAWYGNGSASTRKALQRVVRTAQYIAGAKLPAIQDLYTRQCQRKSLKIVKVSSHPSHRLFSLLPHGKRYRSTKSRSKKLLNSFYPQAIRLLNS